MAEEQKKSRVRTLGRRFADAASRLNDGKARGPKNADGLRTEPQRKGKELDDHWGGYGPPTEWPPSM